MPLSDVVLFAQSQYDIDVLRIEQLTPKVFKLNTVNQDYLLKFSQSDNEFVMKQLFAYKVLKDNVPAIYETRAGHYIAPFSEGHIAYLTDFIDEIPIPLEKRTHEYVKLLHRLHQETVILVDKNDEQINQMYDKDEKMLERSYLALQKSMSEYELLTDKSPFQWHFMMMYPTLYTMLRRADDEMKKFYRLLAREKKLPIALVHGDINIANMIVSKQSFYLINFESSDFKMPVLDTCAFLANYNQVPGSSSIVSDYIKSEDNKLLRHYFFFRALCIDLEAVLSMQEGHSLHTISIFNEHLAPSLLSLQLYDEIMSKGAKKKDEKKAT